MRILLVQAPDGDMPCAGSQLANAGHEVNVLCETDVSADAVSTEHLDAILVDLDGMGATSPGLGRLVTRLREGSDAPLLGIVGEEGLGELPLSLGLDDFVTPSASAAELTARIEQALWRRGGKGSAELIKRGELVIDLRRYEVTVAGRAVPLTFREYELLKFLASDPGRVFGREVLMNKVWGYDYQGGDRAVDVTIRRLRSKIEGRGHIFIETVRNVGYRFREAP